MGLYICKKLSRFNLKVITLLYVYYFSILKKKSSNKQKVLSEIREVLNLNPKPVTQKADRDYTGTQDLL